MTKQRAVIFDLDQTLGYRRICMPGGDWSFVGYPGVDDVLSRLGASAKLGVYASGATAASPTVHEALRQAGIASYFNAALVHEGPLTRTTLEVVARRAVVEPGDCILVSQDRGRRDIAIKSGFRACPHPRLVEAVIAGEPLVYVSLSPSTARVGVSTVLDQQRDATGPVLPLLPARGDGGPAIAIASHRAIAALQEAGLIVRKLGPDNLPETADLCLLLNDGSAQPARDEYVAILPQGMIVVVGPRDDPLDFHRASHCCGGAAILVPTLTLVAAAAPGAGGPAERRALLAAAEPPLLDGEEITIIQQIDAAAITKHHEPWCGKTQANGAKYASRWCTHPDNAKVVTGLYEDLRRIGDGRMRVDRLNNPIASDGTSADNIHAVIEADPTSPTKDEIVVLGAHLDSTAVLTDGWSEQRNTADAPGADDDASGMAAILVAADVLCQLAARVPPKRTIRLVLFNAEEMLKVGSSTYVTNAIASGDRFVAMYQLDMIGYRRKPTTWKYELHVGNNDRKCHAESRALADLVVSSASQVADDRVLDGQAQIHPIPNYPLDPADGRSDHQWFQDHEIPACLVTEDSFREVRTPQIHLNNPTYHSIRDTDISPEYTAQIARAVIAATWRRANA